MIPIEKNIIVVDENGKEYEATYPERAKGLVKNGRARFIDENTICLACPPKNELEDKNMSENKKVLNENNAKAEATTQETTNYTIDYILKKLDEIAKDKSHIIDVLALAEGQIDDLALGNIIEEREKTNRQLISFYEKMYDDLKASQPMSEQKFDLLSLALGDLSRDLTPIQTKEALTEALKLIIQS